MTGIESSGINDASYAFGKSPDFEKKYIRVVLGLHLSLVLLNIVPLFYYFLRSWELAHYQFFPIAFLVFGYYIYSRLDRGQLIESPWAPFFSSLMLSVSTLTFALSISQYNHYLPTVGVFFAVGSLLFCFRDRESEGSLFPAWLLLLPLIRIPLNFDITLITQLQFVSAWFASNVLDFLGIPNFTPGTVIQVADQSADGGVKSFDVERACSGVQSLYTLLFCTLVVAVWGRRSLVKGVLLVASGIFWSITMNGVRIVTCVAFFYWFNVDIYSGIPHEILGYLVLFGAIGLIASTDFFLRFMFGPVDSTTDTRNSIAMLWNRYVAGVEVEISRARSRNQYETGSILVWAGRGTLAFFLLAANICALILMFVSLSGKNLGGTFHVDELGFVAEDLPAEIIQPSEEPVVWKRMEDTFQNITRNSNSTYGPYSSAWVFVEKNRKLTCQISVDYPFLGWHELKVCYKGSGWQIERNPLVARSFAGPLQKSVTDWQPVEMEMSQGTSEFGYCVFSIFDYQGEAVQPMADKLGFFLLRLRNRIAREFSTRTTFQVQCFVRSTNEFSDEDKAAIRELHLKIRELVREDVLKKLSALE